MLMKRLESSVFKEDAFAQVGRGWGSQNSSISDCVFLVASSLDIIISEPISELFTLVFLATIRSSQTQHGKACMSLPDQGLPSDVGQRQHLLEQARGASDESSKTG